LVAGSRQRAYPRDHKRTRDSLRIKVDGFNLRRIVAESEKHERSANQRHRIGVAGINLFKLQMAREYNVDPVSVLPLTIYRQKRSAFNGVRQLLSVTLTHAPLVQAGILSRRALLVG
jgi:hypothetical protein